MNKGKIPPRTGILLLAAGLVSLIIGFFTPPIEGQEPPRQAEATQPVVQQTPQPPPKGFEGLTPEALKALKERPEFQGITPEEILKGKELLEKRQERKEEQVPIEVKPEEKPPAISPGERPRNIFELYWAREALPEKPYELTPFGYELFLQPTKRPFIPQPVAPDYVVGPGDEIEVLLWGRINERYTLTVQNDGTILFPYIGPLTVAGMTYQEMKDFLTKQAEQITGTNVAVTLSRLRSIHVLVLGEVKQPGLHELTAMSTVLDALIAAGGPSPSGTLRKIELRREGRTIAVLDLYDLLLKGDDKENRRLRHGDIVFVPVVGPLIGVAGNVRRPAVYELRGGETLGQVLDLAGGLLPVAWKQRVQVERAEEHLRKTVLDIDASDKRALETFRMRDGDLVKVFSIVKEEANAVYLMGNVVRPGKYALKEGMRVSDVINRVEDLLPDTYMGYALIKRLVLPTLQRELIPFNLGKAILEKDPQENVLLRPYDEIYVFSRWFFEPKPQASVEGEVRNPGTYTIPEEGYTVRDLVFVAGGLTKKAYLEKAELYRTDKRTNVVSLITFNLARAMAGEPDENLKLQDLDRIVIHSVEEFIPKRTVSVWGEVNKPGEYPYAEGMTVKDLIFAAGNIKDSAYLDEAELFSYEVQDGKLCLLKRRTIDLGAALRGDPQHNVVLQPYDKLLVRRIPDWKEERYVEISGEVLFPGKYLIRKGERLSSLIERAGGFTEKAYLRGAVFTRESVRQLQQRNLEEMIDRLERELLAEASTFTGVSPEEAQIRKVELEQRQKFIQQLRELKATGRMVIRLSHPRVLKDSPYDIELMDGDRLYIPSMDRVVTVIGAVYSPGSFVWREGLDYKDYIELAGGFTRYADKANVYLLRADGTAQKIKGGVVFWNEAKGRWELSAFSEDEKIYPGDTIVVPERLERVPWLRMVKDITEILFRIAVTTGAVVNLW